MFATYLYRNPRLLVLAICVAALLWTHLVAFAPFARIKERFFALPAPLRGVAYGLAVVVLVLFVPVGAGTFIYRNF